MNDMQLERARPVRGKRYSIEELCAKYALDPHVAENLFRRLDHHPSSSIF